MIAEACILKIKETSSLEDVVGSFVKLKRKGKDMVGLCPFHSEKTPSFTVSQPKGIYKCFGCGRSGDVIAFLMDHQNLSYIDTIKWLAKKYNIEIEESIKKDFTKPAPRLTKLSEKPLKWFEQTRKISNNTLLRFKITEAIEWMPVAEKDVPVICFNYFRNDELVNIKYRGAGKDFKLSKNSELIFYNIDAIKDEKTAIIVEGEIDCLTLHECGIYNVVSVPNGASKGNQKLEYLDNCWQYFENKEKVILMVDNDEPGYQLREELARRIGKEKCWKVQFPEGCKDPNEVLTQYGKEALTAVVGHAQQWPIEGVLTMDDMFEDVRNFYDNGYPTGVKMGIPDFDELLSFMPGQYTTVTGIPGSGKSEFIDWLMCSSAKNHQWPWGICSFENQPSALHVTKLMEKISGKSFAFRRNQDLRINESDFAYGVGIVDKYFHFININQVEITLQGILDKARELVGRKGIKGLLIDPWNYIEHKVPANYTETQYISECLTEIKTFAVKYGIHVVLIAHPTKLKKEKGKYEVPTMYSISGSAHFFNKTDNGITVYRDFETGQVDIYIQKVRYSWLGKIGFCSFSYNTETRQYKSINSIPVIEGNQVSSWKPYNDN